MSLSAVTSPLAALLLAGAVQAHAATPAPTPVRPAGAVHWTLPANVQLDYAIQGKIKGISYSATSSLKWQADSDHYHLQLDTRLPLLGTRSQVSDGLITNGGLSPERYAEQMRRTNTATVSRAQREVSFSADRPAAEWHEGAQDRLSVMLEIGQWLRSQPTRYQAGQVIDLQVIGPRNAPVWHFRIDGTETVALPSGEVEALKFTRLPRDGRAEDDQVIEFWLAPRYQYLPVRLRWSEDGDGADQLLSGVQGLQ